MSAHQHPNGIGLYDKNSRGTEKGGNYLLLSIALIVGVLHILILIDTKRYQKNIKIITKTMIDKDFLEK